jgi:hypothetical protein
MILGCTEASHGRKKEGGGGVAVAAAEAVVVMCHICSMQIGQDEKTKQDLRDDA